LIGSNEDVRAGRRKADTGEGSEAG